MAKFQLKLFTKFCLAKTSNLFHDSNPPMVQYKQNTNFSQIKPKLLIRIQTLVPTRSFAPNRRRLRRCIQTHIGFKQLKPAKNKSIWFHVFLQSIFSRFTRSPFPIIAIIKIWQTAAGYNWSISRFWHLIFGGILSFSPTVSRLASSGTIFCSLLVSRR